MPSTAPEPAGPQEEPEAKFLIDGKGYDLPGIDSLSMGEALTVYEWSGLSLDEIGEDTKHPGLIFALMVIAYMRGNPQARKAKVVAMLEASSFVEALSQFAEREEASPESPPEPAESAQSKPSSEPSSPSSPPSSGNGSAASSEEAPDVAPSPTGTPGSDMSPTSGHAMSPT